MFSITNMIWVLSFPTCHIIVYQALVSSVIKKIFQQDLRLLRLYWMPLYGCRRVQCTSKWMLLIEMFSVMLFYGNSCLESWLCDVNYLQDWLIKREGSASWPCRIGETKTLSKEKKVGRHAGQTLIWYFSIYLYLRHYLMNVYREKERCAFPIYFLLEINTEENVTTITRTWNFM